MNKLRLRIVMGIAWAIAAVVIVCMLFAYTAMVSEKLYDEAKQNFSEVYQQVEANFLGFMDDAWKNLSDWGPYIHDMDDTAAANYIEQRRAVWGFSRFIFINEQGEGLTLSGESIDIDLGDKLSDLFAGDGKIMAEQGLQGATPQTVFAYAMEPGSYRGFAYQAVAISYTNADLASTLHTDAFSGQSIGFIVYPDGTIALSTQEGGNIFSNYLAYLAAGSNLSDEQIDALRKAWEGRESGVIVCKMNDGDYYLTYQPLEYEDYILLGVVPTDAVSGSLRNVQEMTVDVFVKIFLIVVALGIVQVVIWLRQRTKKSKVEIEYRDALFELLSANLDDIFIVTDADTLKVSYITPNVNRLLGVTPEDAKEDLQLLRNALARSESAVTDGVLRSIAVDERFELSQEWINQRDGSHRWFREAIYRLRIQDEEKIIFILSDHTEDRLMAQNLEDALEAAKHANQAKSQFLSNMSHDIRTPMNAIMGFTALLEANIDDTERVREYIRKISASSRHLLSLINDVLDMSKIESGKTELSIVEFGFAELLEEVNAIMAPQAAAKDQSFEIRMEGRPADYVMGDKLRINQILINLLGNAVKYTPIGGSIEFILKEMPRKNPNYDNVRFIIKDDGIGMSPEYLEVIFDPFTRETSTLTNAVQGTGLGMAITKNLVDLMGGAIKVESTLGEGTTFTVDIAFATADLKDKVNFWAAHPDFRLFIVDDEEYICQDIKRTLEAEGVHVDYANDGATAVEMVRAAHDAGKDYDVVLVDWRMPVQSGVETAREIHEFASDGTIILVLTAFDWAVIEHEALEAGVAGFLPKPFFASSLSQKLVSLTKDAEPEKVVNADALRGLHILAAEDNEMSAEMLIERLDMEGASVQRARNGQEAVEIFEASEPGTFDLILMDVQMPVMGGHEATRTIRAGSHPEAQTIPIFAMTANVYAEDVQEALDAGMNAHVPKPIDMDELRRVADQALNGKDGSNDE